MVVNAYYCPRITNKPHENTNYGYGKSKFEIDYYRHTYGFIQKMA